MLKKISNVVKSFISDTSFWKSYDEMRSQGIDQVSAFWR